MPAPVRHALPTPFGRTQCPAVESIPGIGRTTLTPVSISRKVAWSCRRTGPSLTTEFHQKRFEESGYEWF